MNIYKFKDKVDYRYCFIIANTEADARKILNKQTSLECVLVETKKASELDKGFVIFNRILPF